MPTEPPPLAHPVELAAYAARPSQPATPVQQQDRIATLDILRGVAVLGILLVNILTFAFTLGEFEDSNWSELPVWDAAARLFIAFFGEFKFITIFSMLFGMGLALQYERAQQRGSPFAAMYARRLVVLLVIGLAHGFLLWFGDILSLYAMLGFIALLFRKARPRTLLILAIICFLMPCVILGGCAAAFPDDNSFLQSPDWSAMAEKEETSAEEWEGEAAASRVAEFYRFMADEERVYQRGTYREQLLHRSVIFGSILIFANPMIIGWRCIALFFLGMYMMRRNFFAVSRGNWRTCRLMVILGLLIGIPLQIAGIAVGELGPDTVWGYLAHFAATYVGSMGMSLAYVGIITLLCLRPHRREMLSPLAAVGRMALTNYLSHTVVCCLLFYSFGLGAYGQIDYVTAVLVVFAIYGLQLLFCPVWLRHFQFGPAEWLWRSLTYWRLQPFLRTAEPCASESEPRAQASG
ncbi:MAG: DUF418 domain-containing protein [Planctomycetota bacterium]